MNNELKPCPICGTGGLKMPTRIKEMSGLEYYVPVVRNNNLEWINIFAHPDIKAGVEKALKECKDFDWLLNEVKARPIQSPVAIEYHWVEPNKRRDLDNIAFAKKFINDALVKIGILEGDGWRDIKALKDTFAFESRNPRVEILIRELEVGR